MVDHNRIVALKQRRAIFAGFGQTEKVKAVDVEIARLRGDLPPDPAKANRAEPAGPEPEPAPVVETAVADLSGVEVAEAVRRRGRPPRQG